MRTVRWAVGLVALWSMLVAGRSAAFVPVAAATQSMSVLGWAPGITTGLPLQSPVTVYFSRPIDVASTEAAWQMTPVAPGGFRHGAASITFTPSRALRPNTWYHVSIDASARSASGIPLTPFSIHFKTGDALRMVRLAPASGTQQVPVTGVISVAFNHPMVALGGVNGETTMPRGWSLSISPAVRGHGFWLGTSTWVFHPATVLAPATYYTVTLHRGARDSWGQPLQTQMRWTFRTATPELFSRSPHNYDQFVSPKTDVRVAFSQPMDPRSTAHGFEVTSRHARVPGSITWSGATLIFHPAAQLAGGQTYSVSVARTARSANRQASLQTSSSWQFTVAPSPRVVSTIPGKNRTAWATPPFQGYAGPCCGGGSYSASIIFTTPMNKASLDRHLHIVPAVGTFTTYINRNTDLGGFQYQINGDFKPSTNYTITIDPGVVDAFGRLLPGSVLYPFKTSKRYPSVTLYGMPNSSMFAFSSGQIVRAPMQTINVPNVHFHLVKTTMFALQHLNAYCGDCPPDGTTVRKWSETTGGGTNQIANPGVEVKSQSGKALAPGLYWLGAQANNTIPGWGNGPQDQSWPPFSNGVFVVNNVSITAKSGSNGTLAWVNDTKTGKPLQDVLVRLVDGRGVTLTSGITDGRGLHFFRGYSQNGGQYVYGAEVRDAHRFGLAALYWQADTTSPSNFSWPWQQGQPSSNGTYAYTDRPIYRPGQTVHFRALLWTDHDAVYALPGAKQVQISVNDSRGKQILNRRMTLDRFGAINGTVTLAPNAPTGDFNLYASITKGPSVGTAFSVADYRKPEFLTSVRAASPRYAQGQTAAVKVSVQYVFGAPVTHERIHWTAYSNPTTQSPPGWDTYQFVNWEQLWNRWWQIDTNPYQNSGQLGKAIASGTGSTDGNGKLIVHFPVNVKTDPLERNVDVEVTATDKNAQSVSGRATLAEYHSDLAIGTQTETDTVAAGSPASVKVVTVHQSGAIAPNTSLTATVARRTYTSKLISTNGSTQWQPVPTDTPVSTQTLTTDATGKATLTFTPTDGGEYFVVISGADAAGNPTSTSLSIYASASGVTNWSQSQNSSISLKTDHPTYAAGQTAHILVPSPFADPTVLVSVERSTIRHYWTTTFSGTTGTIDVPLGIDALPNEYVSVTLYHGWRGNVPPEWRTGTAELHLRLDPRHVKITLAQTGGRQHPGGRVTYTVHSTTMSGRPISAELSLALVDTAVLALKDQPNADILQALYAERPLGVSTASEGAISIDNLTQRANFQLAPPASGKQVVSAGPQSPVMAGGGGGPPTQHASALDAAYGPNRSATGVTLRTRFVDTAYWRGAVTTNSAGTAHLSLRLPDNTTTWLLDARAISASRSVGGSTLTTLATRDLVLRPILPRFFVQGDHLHVGVALNNRLAHAVTATVTLNASGLRLASRPESVSVPARGERVLLFPATVPISQTAVLTARATPQTTGVLGDAVQQAVPVHAPLTDETTATTGQVYDTTRQLVIVPRRAVSTPGALTVSVQSSITAGLGDAYTQLKPSQYESNDDVAARVLAAASLRSVRQPITGLSGKAYRRLPLDTALGVQRLLDTQWYDGGWPWFTDSLVTQSDPLVTADAVQALAASGRHGSLVNTALQRGQRYLLSQLGRVEAPLRAQILAVLVASHSGASTPHDNAERLYADSIRRLHLDAGALANLGSALGLSGDVRKGKSVIAALQASAKVSATGAHWETTTASFWGGPPIDNTAEVLTTLLQLSPNDPLEPAAARWLMLARQNSGWDCNRDSAQAIAVLARYARAAREGTADYQYRVALPVSRPLHGWYTPHSTRFSATMSVPISSLHRKGATRIDISRTAGGGSYGTGPLYYLARLHYFLPANDIPARDEGVSVSRRFLTLAGLPVTSVQLGSALKVELTVRTAQTLVYLDLRDPLCSGCEPIDASLNTSQQGIAQRPQWYPWQRVTSVQDLTPYLIHSDLRDDQIALYAYSLPPGTYRYTYLVQATVAGTYAVPPTHASEHFFPEVFGRSQGQVLTIR